MTAVLTSLLNLLQISSHDPLVHVYPPLKKPSTEEV